LIQNELDRRLTVARTADAARQRQNVLHRDVRAGTQGFAQTGQVGIQVPRVLFNPDMINPGRTVVRRHGGERRTQRCLGVDLIDQTILNPAFGASGHR
jgi:hypothetical protein